MTVQDPFLLLVEDNEDDVVLARRALSEEGLPRPAVVARDGAEALDYLFARGSYAGRDQLELPQVVLMDLNMPRLSGIEALREIRRNERTRYLPVVMFTTSGRDRDIADSYAAGANSYLRKPLNYREFQAVAKDIRRYWLRLNETPAKAAQN